MSARWVEVLARVEAALDVPYPARAEIVDELQSDLDAAFKALRARGLSETEARDRAVHELALDDGALASLAEVHAPKVRRALLAFSPETRDWVEWLCATVPLGGLLFLLAKEVPVAHYLREGGGMIFGVLAVGLLALLLQFHRLFLWFVVRDHSPAALAKNTSTPLYLAAATFLLGVLTTAVNYYVVFYRWAEEQLPFEVVRVGLREPLPCLVVGTSLASIIVLVQGVSQAGLRALRVPEHKGA